MGQLRLWVPLPRWLVHSHIWDFKCSLNYLSPYGISSFRAPPCDLGFHSMVVSQYCTSYTVADFYKAEVNITRPLKHYHDWYSIIFSIASWSKQIQGLPRLKGVEKHTPSLNRGGQSHIAKEYMRWEPSLENMISHTRMYLKSFPWIAFIWAFQ